MGIALAMLAAACLRLGWSDGLAYLSVHHVTMSASWGIFWVALGAVGLYDSDRRTGLRTTMVAATIAVLGGMLLATALLLATSSWQIAGDLLVVFAILALLSVLAMSVIHRMTRGLGFLTSRCLVIGANDDAQKVIDLIHRHPHAGLRVVGVVECGKQSRTVGTLIGECPVLGTDASLAELIGLHRVDQLIVAAPSEIEAALLGRLRSFRYRGMALADYVSLHEELTQEIPVEAINDEWLVAAAMNNSRPHIRRVKRAVDIVASLAGLILATPITAVAALLVKLDSAGPVFFRQERLGRDGVAFTILKLRTMIVDAETRTGPVWASDDDPRITRVGRWLRKFRIDELPQLVNVLHGEMSLVGPRPEREVFATQLAERIPFYRERFMVRPGITGWAQVMQPYADSIEASRRKLQADLYYVKHVSFLTDLYIILRTLHIVVSGRERSRRADVSRAGHPKAALSVHLPGPEALIASAAVDSRVRANLLSRVYVIAASIGRSPDSMTSARPSA